MSRARTNSTRFSLRREIHFRTGAVDEPTVEEIDDLFAQFVAARALLCEFLELGCRRGNSTLEQST